MTFLSVTSIVIFIERRERTTEERTKENRGGCQAVARPAMVRSTKGGDGEVNGGRRRDRKRQKRKNERGETRW